jgi:D-serine dehydratase
MQMLWKTQSDSGTAYLRCTENDKDSQLYVDESAHQYLQNFQFNLGNLPSIHVDLSVAITGIRLDLSIEIQVSADNPVWLFPCLTS